MPSTTGGVVTDPAGFKAYMHPKYSTIHLIMRICWVIRLKTLHMLANECYPFVLLTTKAYTAPIKLTRRAGSRQSGRNLTIHPLIHAQTMILGLQPMLEVSVGGGLPRSVSEHWRQARVCAQGVNWRKDVARVVVWRNCARSREAPDKSRMRKPRMYRN